MLLSFQCKFHMVPYGSRALREYCGLLVMFLLMNETSWSVYINL